MERRGVHNLPAQLTRFVGRRAELADARRALAETRLLTLSGPGGAGKTRLALELAPRLLPEFPDGVWLVELNAVAHGDLVSQEVAAALGFREPSREPLQGLAGQLASRRLLLVLDNCEHVVAGTRRVAETLLKGCPGLYILATSREPLNVPGEVVLRVPALEASEAVALFVERARAARPGFKQTAANAPVLTAICARLEGIPLALELAAALVRLLSVEEILARLDQRLELPVPGSRQRALRATIEWSHSLLSPEEQRLFRRLAVFQGGFRLDSAEAVCSEGGSVLPALAGLVDKSVALAAAEGASGRYRMLETIAEFARERLQEAGETEEISRRYNEHFESLILRGDRDHVAWLARIQEDYDNVRAGLPRMAASVAAALGEFWLQHGYLREARQWLDPARARPSERLVVLLAAADIEFYQGDYALAARHYRKAVELARRDGDQAKLGLALVGLGQVVHAEDHLPEARELFEEGLAVERRLGNRHGMTRALGYLGLLAAQEGRLEEAAAASNEGLAISREIGDPTGIYRALRNLAVTAFLGREFARARELCEEGLRFSRQQGNQVGIPMWLEGFAALAAGGRRHERAIRLAGAAAALRTRMQSAASPPWGAAITAILEPSRLALGGRAAAAWQAGTNLELDAAVAEALEERPAASGQPRLTARELEIAGLVADGRSNKEIAAGLFIKGRTAETHVQNIMNKLGLNSRAQIAAWEVERRHREAAPT